MTVDCFLDANIFLYGSSAAPDDARKQACAAELITEENFGVSSQAKTRKN